MGQEFGVNLSYLLSYLKTNKQNSGTESVVSYYQNVCNSALLRDSNVEGTSHKPLPTPSAKISSLSPSDRWGHYIASEGQHWDLNPDPKL